VSRIRRCPHLFGDCRVARAGRWRAGGDFTKTRSPQRAASQQGGDLTFKVFLGVEETDSSWATAACNEGAHAPGTIEIWPPLRCHGHQVPKRWRDPLRGTPPRGFLMVLEHPAALLLKPATTTLASPHLRSFCSTAKRMARAASRAAIRLTRIGQIGRPQSHWCLGDAIRDRRSASYLLA